MKRNIILDTDIGCDCDDAGALYILNVFCDRDDADIKAVTHTTSQKHGIACVSAINKYFNRTTIPLGVLKEGGFLDADEFDTYATKTAEKYPCGVISGDNAEDAVRVLRRALAKSEEKSIHMCFIGQLKNAAMLLRSQPDEISPLTGIELVSTKVAEITVMGGDFSKAENDNKKCNDIDAEYNIKCDIPSAKYFCENCPVKTVFCGFELGTDILTGKEMLALDNDENPTNYMYKLHGGERSSWDLLAVLYCVKGAEENFELSNSGSVRITDTGISIFEASTNGKHFYLKLKADKKVIERLLNKLLIIPPKKI